LVPAGLAGKDGLCFHGQEASGGVTALIIEESVE
jgi:hypothetical protein